MACYFFIMYKSSDPSAKTHYTVPVKSKKRGNGQFSALSGLQKRPARLGAVVSYNVYNTSKTFFKDAKRVTKDDKASDTTEPCDANGEGAEKQKSEANPEHCRGERGLQNREAVKELFVDQNEFLSSNEKNHLKRELKTSNSCRDDDADLSNCDGIEGKVTAGNDSSLGRDTARLQKGGSKASFIYGFTNAKARKSGFEAFQRPQNPLRSRAGGDYFSYRNCKPAPLVEAKVTSTIDLINKPVAEDTLKRGYTATELEHNTDKRVTNERSQSDPKTGSEQPGLAPKRVKTDGDEGAQAQAEGDEAKWMEEKELSEYMDMSDCFNDDGYNEPAPNPKQKRLRLKFNHIEKKNKPRRIQSELLKNEIIFSSDDYEKYSNLSYTEKLDPEYLSRQNATFKKTNTCHKLSISGREVEIIEIVAKGDISENSAKSSTIESTDKVDRSPDSLFEVEKCKFESSVEITEEDRRSRECSDVTKCLGTPCLCKSGSSALDKSTRAADKQAIGSADPGRRKESESFATPNTDRRNINDCLNEAFASNGGKKVFGGISRDSTVDINKRINLDSDVKNILVSEEGTESMGMQKPLSDSISLEEKLEATVEGRSRSNDQMSNKHKADGMCPLAMNRARNSFAFSIVQSRAQLRFNYNRPALFSNAGIDSAIMILVDYNGKEPRPSSLSKERALLDRGDTASNKNDSIERVECKQSETNSSLIELSMLQQNERKVTKFCDKNQLYSFSISCCTY